MSNIRSLFFFILAFLALAAASHSEIISVPDDFETIQAAIDASEDGDTVLVQPGVYQENIDFDGHNIVVGSLYLITGDTTYTDSTVIDGDEHDTAVIIASGENENTVLTGFTIRNGNGPLGGGLFIRRSNPRLDHLLIRDNYSQNQGGGIYIDRDAGPLFTCVSVVGNASHQSRSGGGVYCTERASPTFRSCLINSNTAYYGGGIALRDSSRLILSDVIISDNFSRDHGAGIHCDYYSHLILNDVWIVRNRTDTDGGNYGGGIHSSRSEVEMTGVTIMDNFSSYEGGGLSCSSSLLNIVNSVIISNTTRGSGGGMMLDTGSNIIMNRVIVAGNSAGRNGGGILHNSRYSGRVKLSMTFVVLALNNASLDGGGLYLSNGSNSLMVNSILWNNEPQEIFAPREEELNNLTVSHSLIDGGEDGIEGNHNLEVNWMEGNVFADPRFVDPENSDYNLLEESPCVEVGTAFFILDEDTLLNLTPDDYFGEAPDIGARESEYSGIGSGERIQPERLILLPIYPNPFNSTTTIRYNLPMPTHVSLGIYNPLGRKVDTLFEGYRPAGFHNIDLSAATLSSGIYFVQLGTSREMKVRKIICIK